MTAKSFLIISFALVFVGFGISVPALAQEYDTNAKLQLPKSDKRGARPNKALINKKNQKASSSHRRWSVMLLYDTADKVVYGGNVQLLTGPTRFVVTNQTSGQLGLGGGYLYTSPWSFGYGGDLIAELPRGSQGLSGTAGNTQITGTLDGNPLISLITINAAGNYSFGERLYAFAGFNYPFVFSTDSSSQFTGLIGYQGGLGGVIAEDWRIEAGYHLTAMKGHASSSGVNYDVTEADFAGATILVRYSFK